MNPRYLLRALWTSAVALGIGAIVEWVGGTPRVAVDNDRVTIQAGAAPVLRAISSDSIDDAAAATSDHNPFRFTREPSSVPYEPDRDGVGPAPPAPPRPPLALSGIVGPPWVGVLEGVPGRTGSVLAKAGDTLARPPLALLVVHWVSHDTVVVRGADTTWTLIFYRPWR